MRRPFNLLTRTTYKEWRYLVMSPPSLGHRDFFFTSAPVLPRRTRLHAIHAPLPACSTFPPSLASLLSLPFGLRHRFPPPSLSLPSLLHPSRRFLPTSISFTRLKRRRGEERGREKIKKSRREEEIPRPVGGAGQGGDSDPTKGEWMMIWKRTTAAGKAFQVN